jgi:hypothetical protein
MRVSCDRGTGGQCQAAREGPWLQRRSQCR